MNTRILDLFIHHHSLSAFYKSAKTTTDEQAIAVIQKCLESGVTLVNSAVFYGPLTTEGYGKFCKRFSSTRWCLFCI